MAEETYSLLTRAHSEVGLVRKSNQDSAYCSGNMLLVADGMGGAAAGDLASAVAVQEIAKADRRLDGEDMLSALSAAVSRANDNLADLIEVEHSLDGMGTTVCGALFSGTQLGMVHLGDSRGYLRRGDTLTQITHDHSWVQSLVDEGKLHEDEMATHPHRSLLLRVLNGQPVNDPDSGLIDVQLGDRLLFCSDGLSGFTTVTDLERLTAIADIDDAVAQLAQAARDGGGADNITFVVADVVAHDPELDKAPGQAFGAAANPELREVLANLTQMADATSGAPGAATQAIADHSDTTDTLPGKAPLLQATSDAASVDAEAPVDPELLRYLPAKRGRRWVPTVALLVAMLALIGGAGVGGYYYLRTQYFVGSQNTASGQKVAIYRGIPDSLLGHPLNQVVDTQTTFVGDLPKFYRQQVTSTIATDNLQSAYNTALSLQQLALTCIALRGSVGAQTTPPVTEPTTPSPTPTPTTSATLTTSQRPGSSATPRITPGASSGSKAPASPKTSPATTNPSKATTTSTHSPSADPGTTNAEQDCS